jgi:cyclic pyranopterin monophosphate synthase
MTSRLTHIDRNGKAKMVDVGSKIESERLAIAKGEICMDPISLEVLLSGSAKKGDVLGTAQIAGIQAAKRTADLIPLCHPLLLTNIDVDLEPDRTLPGVRITATVKTTGRTGVEMEALTAVSVAALTVYDMIKAIDKHMTIGQIRLVEKHGGRSGDIVNE